MGFVGFDICCNAVLKLYAMSPLGAESTCLHTRALQFARLSSARRCFSLYLHTQERRLHDEIFTRVAWEIVFQPLPPHTRTPFTRRELRWLLVGPAKGEQNPGVMRDAFWLSVGTGTRVSVAERDPFCALQACMEGFQVVVIEIVVPEIDILVPSTGNFNISMNMLKNNAFFGDTRHFDKEIDLAGSEGLEGMKVDSLKPQWSLRLPHFRYCRRRNCTFLHSVRS